MLKIIIPDNNAKPINITPAVISSHIAGNFLKNKPDQKPAKNPINVTALIIKARIKI